MTPIKAWERWAVVTKRGQLWFVGHAGQSKAEVDLGYAAEGDRVVRVEIRELLTKEKQ